MTSDILKFKAASHGISSQEIERIINKFLIMDRLQVQAAITDPKIPMLELLLASIVANAAQKGDPMRAEFILSCLRRSTLRSPTIGSDQD